MDSFTEIKNMPEGLRNPAGTGLGFDFPGSPWYDNTVIQEDGIMQFLGVSLFVAGIVAADQFTKYLTVANIALYEDVPFLPGLLQLTYIQNTGAAFSSFEGQQWLFALIFAVFTLLIIREYRKQAMGFTTFEWWCIAAIYGGGLGNMIDRVRLGYVVDMIETTFVEFPVFNVADCFITCGCVLLMAHLVLFHKDFWKDDKKK